MALALGDRVRTATEGAVDQTAAAPAALVALREFLGGRSVDDLRRVVGLSPSGAVRLVDRLVDAGLVERGAGPDRRTVAVVLTAAGDRAARRVQAARAAALVDLVAELTSEERTALTRVSERLLAIVARTRLDERAAGAVPPGGWMCRLCDQVACGRPVGECPAAQALSLIHI